jgi:hypothetical protein
MKDEDEEKQDKPCDFRHPIPRTPRPVPAGAADPGLCARFIATCAVMAYDGGKLNKNLLYLLEPQLSKRVQHRADVAQRTRKSPVALKEPKITAMRLCTINCKAIEATVLCQTETRFRAVAIRLERHHKSWQATSLLVL